MIKVNISGSYNGSTPGSEPVNEGPIPSPEASQKKEQNPIRGGSDWVLLRLSAYTKSKLWDASIRATLSITCNFF